MATSLLPPQYPELLRTLGQWLDARSADDVQLSLARSAGGDPYWAVRWKTVEGTWTIRRFTAEVLTALSEEARARRQSPAGAAGGEWGICLRALGQELASREMEMHNVRLEEAGFRVSGHLQGRYVSEWYGLEQHLEHDQSRRNERLLEAMRAARPAKPSGWRALFRRS